VCGVIIGDEGGFEEGERGREEYKATILCFCVIIGVNMDSNGVERRVSLGVDEYLYDPDVLGRVRGLFGDREVAVVDANGVLVSDSYAEVIRLNPEAKEFVEVVKDTGRPVVLWTSSGRRGETYRVLEEESVISMVDLVITLENFVRDGDRLGVFNQVVAETPWLSEEVRGLFTSEIAVIQKSRKTPEVVFPRSVLVDDEAAGYWYPVSGFRAIAVDSFDSEGCDGSENILSVETARKYFSE
jgi:hypothetical protein